MNVTNDASGLTCAQQIALSGNQRLLDIPVSAVVGKSHFACAAKGLYQDWCYASIEDPADALGSLATWYPYKQEIVMIHMLPPFEIRRLLHHRSHPIPTSGNACRNPRLSTNWDGTKVIYASPFPSAIGSPCYSDIYRYDAP